MEKSKKDIQEELEQLSPLLAKMKKEEGFTVPKNYFSDLPDSILEQLDFPKPQVEEKKIRPQSWLTPIIEGFWMMMQPRVMVGFGVVILLGLSGVFLFEREEGATSGNLADVSYEEALEYIAMNIEEFDEEILVNIALENGVEELVETSLQSEGAEEYMNEVFEEMDMDELEEYL